jgi:hypothetical protein
MKAIKARLEDLARTVKCSKDFECLRSRFAKLCPAQDIGLQNNLLCFAGSTFYCDYCMALGAGQFCQCPIRIYIGKKLKK